MKRNSTASLLIVSAVVFCLFFVFLDWKSSPPPSSPTPTIESIKQPPTTHKFSNKPVQKKKILETGPLVASVGSTQAQNEVPSADYVNEDQSMEETKFSSMDIPTLQKFLKDPNPDVAAEAQKELTRRGKEENPYDLLAIASDESQQDRLGAFQALLTNSEVDKETLHAALRGALSDPDISLASAAVQFLSGKSDQDSLNTLKEAYESSTEQSRKLMIVQSLASNSSAVPMLTQAVAKEDDERVKKVINTILAKSE